MSDWSAIDMASEKHAGIISSICPISFENRFIITPGDVDSKNEMGVFIIFAIILS
jgi:hypothetical protein